MSNLPARMRALQISGYPATQEEAVANLQVVEKDLPRPGHGQLLVRMAAAPCNPSDLLFMQGRYGVRKPLPAVPGWEGAGTVVASGGGLMARAMLGRRVAVGAQDPGRDGTWAEYFVADALACVPLRRGVDFDQGAALLVNPLTVLALRDLARSGKHTAAVQTAGASQVGRMLVRLAVADGYPLISIVRRPAQAALLRELGAQHVLDSSAPGFAAELAELCTRLGATLAYDAVGGAITGTLVNAMPPGAQVYVYGALDPNDCSGIDPIGLIFHKKAVRGFFLGDWVNDGGIVRALRAAYRVQSWILAGTVHTEVLRKVPLDAAPEALGDYLRDMTAGKVLLCP